MIKSGKSYSYWLARFNRKMSFHFPWVDPLISDRSVWHKATRVSLWQVKNGVKMKKTGSRKSVKRKWRLFSYDRPRGSR